MYYSITGKVIKKEDNYAVIENGGIGYKIFTSLTSMGDMNGTVTVFTHLNVREDAMELYGFTTLEEKNMFLKLLSVSGVGPKAALSILSVASPAKFALAVITDDVKTITQAQGVGPKLAKRVILELKDKIKNENLDIPEEEESLQYGGGSNRSEAVSALVVLGYSPADARRAVEGAEEGLSVEEIIKKALAALM